MAYGSVATRASNRFDYNTVSWVKGHEFTWEEYYQKMRLEIYTTHDTITAPSAAYFMGKVMFSTFVITFMWWYFDHVVPDNRGVAFNFYFMF